MKVNQSSLLMLHQIMDSLSKGIDPTSNIAFSEDTLLNSKFLQQSFEEAAKIFKAMISSSNSETVIFIGDHKSRKLPFYLQRDELDIIPISKSDISISRFVFLINEKIQRDGMKKLRATQITSWLTENEYLIKVEADEGIEYKMVTEKGQKVGIRSEYKVNSRGNEYVTNMYSEMAQHFLVSEVFPMLLTII